MAAINTLGVDNLSLRGVNSEYNRLSRFFKTRVEAEAALADGTWVPTVGVKNACVTGDEGILVFDETTSTLVNADSATRSYIDAQLTTLVGDAPDTLDQLHELADAMGDDPNFLVSLTQRVDDLVTDLSVLQTDVNTNETDSDAAESALSTRVDVLEVDPVTATYVDSADTALGTRIDTVEADYATKVELTTAETNLTSSINDAITNSNSGDAALDARLDVLEADPVTKTYVDTQVSGLIDAAPGALDTLNELAAAMGDDANFVVTVTDQISAVQSDVDANEATALAARNVIQANVDANETDIEDKVSDVNAALGLSVGDTSFTFNEDLLIVQLDQSRSTDHAGIYSDITTGGPDSSTNLDIKTAIERFAANSRIVLAAEKIRMDLEDQRVDDLLGSTTSDLGTFDKDIISDSSDVKSALQELETSVASIQGASKVHNYKWSNNNDTTITAQHITTDAADWANATKVYIHRQARHSVDMQNAFNNMLLVGAKLYIQRTDVGDKFFTAIINSAATVTGTGTDQVFAYDVTGVETIGQVFNENMRVNVGVFSNVNAKMVADVQADVDQNEADADAAIAAVQADVDQNESDSDAAIATERARIDAILAGASADTDTFAEVVALVNSVDTANDNAFAGYVTSNDAALAAVQADVDQNESDADAAIAAVQADVDQNEADADSAIAAVQADVDANETASDAAEAALSGRLDTLEADPVTKAYVDGTTTTEALTRQAQDTTLQGNIDAVQADVNQNEADADAAIALKSNIASPTFTGTPAAPTAGAGTNTTQLATTAFVSTAVANLVDGAPGAIDTLNELAAALGDDANFSTTITNSIAAVQADVDQNESDADAAIAAVQADVDQNEADADAAIAGILDGATFTGDLLLKKSDGSAVDLEFSRTDHDDMNTVFKIGASYVDVNKECLVISGGGQPIAYFDERQRVSINKTDPDHTLDVGGDGKFSTNLIVGGTLTLGSTAITATAAELNYVDGVTSNVQTQLDAIQADVNTNESDADSAIAAVQADVDQNESDADAAIAAVQADVDQNESDADAAIALKADIAGPTFTGVPAAPTASAGTNSTQVATTAFVTTAVANVIDSAPGALDTLNELAAALGDDANFSTTITNMVNANETHIDNAVTLTGVAKDAVNLGTFTGSTVSDSRNIKQAVQELETAVEAAQANVVSSDTVKTQIAANSANYFLTFVDSNNVSATAEAVKTGTNLKFNPSTKVLDISSGTVHAQYLTLDNVNVDATADELNVLDGITATTAELNYTDGVTSNIQTQLDAIQSDVDQNESDADAAIAAVLAGTSIPGPYNNDSDAATAGVAVGALYKNSNGSLHWRVS